MLFYITLKNKDINTAKLNVIFSFGNENGFITKVQYNDIDGEWFWAYLVYFLNFLLRLRLLTNLVLI
tara:strand:- start:110 stop:310 length:201 start_codon:yes stop_codon:yes gene_type:complete